MSFIEEIENKGLKTTLEKYSPGILVSKHVLETRQTNGIRLIAGTLAIFAVSVADFFRKAKKTEKDYNTLIYVPNEKYTRFLTALTENAKYNYLVVSDSRLSVESFILSDYASFSRTTYLFPLIRDFFSVVRTCRKNNELSILRQYYWTMFSVLRRERMLNCILKKVKFKNFLSFQPIDSYHSIVQNSFKNKFITTFSIRPTTTSHSEENRYYKTDVLFYKSADECDIYKEMCSPEIKLEKGGLLYPSGLYGKGRIPTRKCMFFDTCTSKDEKWNESRQVFLNAYMEYAKENSLHVYFKFHPGLLPELRQVTEKQLADYDNVEIIDNKVPWGEVDFSIGFSSTIFYDSILHGVPVFDMGSQTYFFDDENSDYRVNKIEELKRVTDFYQHKEEVTEAQYNWLSKEYHYPQGIENINARLMA